MTLLVSLCSAVAATAAVAIAFVAFSSDRAFRTRDSLSRLLERFQTRDLHVLSWRMERITRTGNDTTTLDRVDVSDLWESLKQPNYEGQKRVFELMIGEDWSVDRAGMHELYFFALQTHAWLVAAPSPIEDPRERI